MPSAKCQVPSAKSQDPRAKSQEPRAKSARACVGFLHIRFIWPDTMKPHVDRDTIDWTPLFSEPLSGHHEPTCWSVMLSLSSSLSTITTPLYIHSMKNLEWQEQTLIFEVMEHPIFIVGLPPIYTFHEKSWVTGTDIKFWSHGTPNFHSGVTPYIYISWKILSDRNRH